MAITTANATYGSSNYPSKSLTVTAASNTNPIVVTTSTPHLLMEGNPVTIASVGGNTAANVTGNATSLVDRTNFILTGVAGNGAYTSGGTVTVGCGGKIAETLGSPDAEVVYGTATVTGDGASSTFDVNFIDGTSTLPFTPGAVIAFRTGGAATATISVVSATSPTATKFTVNTSANVNAATFIISFIAWK